MQMNDVNEARGISRRRVLQGLASSMVLLAPNVAAAKIDQLLVRHYGDVEISQQGITVTLPTLAENGNSVPIKIVYTGVEGEVVKNLKVFAPENPAPLIAEFDFGAGQKKLEISSRMRLANSQAVMAVAQTHSGKLYAGAAETVITLAACVEPLL